MLNLMSFKHRLGELEVSLIFTQGCLFHAARLERFERRERFELRKI
jgi:hypothetical protein